MWLKTAPVVGWHSQLSKVRILNEESQGWTLALEFILFQGQNPPGNKKSSTRPRAACQFTLNTLKERHIRKICVHIFRARLPTSSQSRSLCNLIVDRNAWKKVAQRGVEICADWGKLTHTHPLAARVRCHIETEYKRRKMRIMLPLLLLSLALVSCAPPRCDPGFRGKVFSASREHTLYYHACVRTCCLDWTGFI